ncbi:MAG: M20/M25/M40 family metallo-hydrolase, partial [Gammaproteobacteria bacterium]|nr:M20/M25/M40 family metallo-hydrolase [Gammaproteobacteria bacterium]
MAQFSETINLAQQLIREASVSPEDGDCQKIMAEYLEGLGFDVEHMPFGPVKNLWATRTGSSGGPLMVFAGHTDVVPPGPLTEWQIPPYSADIADNTLHGRGAADMKGSLAAMMTASRRFLADTDYHGTLAFLITSDEEDA